MTDTTASRPFGTLSPEDARELIRSMESIALSHMPDPLDMPERLHRAQLDATMGRKPASTRFSPSSRVSEITVAANVPGYERRASVTIGFRRTHRYSDFGEMTVFDDGSISAVGFAADTTPSDLFGDLCSSLMTHRLPAEYRSESLFRGEQKAMDILTRDLLGPALVAGTSE